MPVDGWFTRPGGGVTGWLTRDGQQQVFSVTRHGESRKYWEAHYPDGTHTATFTTMESAKRRCEDWEPDPTLVPLVDAATTHVAPAAAEPLPFRTVIDAHLWDVSGPTTHTSKAHALNNVHVLTQMRATVEQLIRENIATARTGVRDNWGGWRWGHEPRTWSDIGRALGVSKQAAATRYGDKER